MLFHNEASQAKDQTYQSGWAIVILGNFQILNNKSSELTLFWRGVGLETFQNPFQSELSCGPMIL